MSVPLDRLYNFLHDVTSHNDLIIYRFYPHGSRKITDLKRLIEKNEKFFELHKLKDIVFFHDQEPLNFDLYGGPNEIHTFMDLYGQHVEISCISHLLEKYRNILDQILPDINLKIVLDPNFWARPAILVHSEKRSSQLNRYQSYGSGQLDNFIGVYWWCHALIARDWFRYAQYDTNLNNQQTTTHDFLIYNRAWAGTREYRLKFTELLIQNNLVNHCLTWFNPVDNGCEYQNHQFKNSNFELENFNLQEFFNLTTADSSSSADYCSADYQRTNIEVVLETLFDDDRLHLTEKILRPIACAQPFMLAATIGSLEYLRGYGFETFSDLIDESYDTIPDPAERLQAICAEMKRISQLPAEQRTQLFNSMKQIALRNQQRFFSKQWQQSIVDEFKQNFDHAYTQLKQAIKYPV